MAGEKLTLDYLVPLTKKQSELDKYNKEFGTDFKDTEWHMNHVVQQLYDMVTECGNKNNLYMNDGFRIKIEVSHEPEDK